MNRSIAVLATVCCLLALHAGSARAQLAEPTPTPDPLIYTDPAMTFRAPADAYAAGQHPTDVADLADDLKPVAIWVLRPGREDVSQIQLQMESFTGTPDQWESAFESQTHSGGDGILIRGKTPMTLTNGMPAYFVEVATGSGFSATKTYAVLWADGQRGVALEITSRLGFVSAEDAKKALHDVSAVRYPTNQP